MVEIYNIISDYKHSEWDRDYYYKYTPGGVLPDLKKQQLQSKYWISVVIVTKMNQHWPGLGKHQLSKF